MTVFDGDLADYRAWRLTQPSTGGGTREIRSDTAEATSPTDRKQQKREEAEARQRLSQQKKPLQKQLAALEKKMDTFNVERVKVEQQLSDEALYLLERKADLQAALKRQGDIIAALAEAEGAWLELHMALEAMG